MNDFEIQEPMQVANFIIERGNSTDRPISNLHLQKILYFLQAAFLVEFSGSPLMSGNFSKWSYGPVMAEVYNMYRENGSSSIKELAPNISFKNFDLIIDAPKKIKIDTFDKKALDFLKSTSDMLINTNPWELVNLTHEQEIWSKFEQKINMHLAKDYSNEEIRTQFIKNPGDQIWQQA